MTQEAAPPRKKAVPFGLMSKWEREAHLHGLSADKSAPTPPPLEPTAPARPQLPPLDLVKLEKRGVVSGVNLAKKKGGGSSGDPSEGTGFEGTPEKEGAWGQVKEAIHEADGQELKENVERLRIDETRFQAEMYLLVSESQEYKSRLKSIRSRLKYLHR